MIKKVLDEVQLRYVKEIYKIKKITMKDFDDWLRLGVPYRTKEGGLNTTERSYSFNLIDWHA